MPIPHDPDLWAPDVYHQEQPPSSLDAKIRGPSVGILRSEDCEGPILDTSTQNTLVEGERDEMVGGNGEALCSDRAELIERIKRGESPTWVPNQAVSRLWTVHWGFLLDIEDPISLGERLFALIRLLFVVTTMNPRARC